MKSDKNGVSTCKPGKEKFEFFKVAGGTWTQYEYRTPLGKLFSCVSSSLRACRDKRDKWLENILNS